MNGLDGFTAGLTTYGAAAATIDRYVVYKVDVGEGGFAGQIVKIAVAIRTSHPHSRGSATRALSSDRWLAL